MNRTRVLLVPLAYLLTFSPLAAQCPSLAHVRERESTRAYRECSAESIRRLGVSSGGFVADVGAGYGFYAERLSAIVGPTGRVFAVEVDRQSLRALRQRLGGPEFRNVAVLEGRPDNPGLAAGSLDAILIVRAYHDMTEPRSMLARMREALRPGGRLVMLDHRNRSSQPDDARDRQVARHEIAPAIAAAELREAGFEIVEKLDSVCEGQPDAGSRGENLWMLVARRPAT